MARRATENFPGDSPYIQKSVYFNVVTVCLITKKQHHLSHAHMVFLANMGIQESVTNSGEVGELGMNVQEETKVV